ncbi:MAG: hypothetical protein AAB797_00220 [Patescibacteria group bacterium]
MTSDYYLKYEKERCLDCAQKIYSGYLPKDQYKTAQDIFNNLKDDYEKNKFLKTSFFYFHRGWNIANKSGWQEEFDEGFIFITLISVLETIMSPSSYLDFGNWLKKNNKIGNAVDLWKEYNTNFGITKKVKDFFEKYIDKNNKEVFLSRISIWDKNSKEMIKHNNVAQIADLFYSLRSEYVHCSEIIPICENVAASFSFNGIDYSSDVNFKQFREILEASFLNYFLEKAGEIKVVVGKE